MIVIGLGFPILAGANAGHTPIDAPDNALAYAVVEIPPLQGDVRFDPTAINNRGDVVGVSLGPNNRLPYPAFYSHATGTIALPTLPGLEFGIAYDINEAGIIVGALRNETVESGRAVRWGPGGPELLGSLGGVSVAVGVNATGAAVGSSWVGPTGYDGHAFLDADGVGMVDLTPNQGPNLYSVAEAINDAGQVAGFHNNPVICCGPARAFRWESGVLTDLGVLGSDDASFALAINAAGEVACTSHRHQPQTSRVCRSTGAGLQDLGGLGIRQDAAGINVFGDIVGSAYTGTVPFHVAFLYRSGVGHVELNDLIDPALGYSIRSASDINDARVIVGRHDLLFSASKAGVLLVPTGPDSPPAPPVVTSAHLTGVDRGDVAIRWELSADDGLGANDVVRYEILAGSAYNSSGVGYSLLATVRRGTNAFVDGRAGPSATFYQVRALDATGHARSAEVQSAKMVVPLVGGWNLLASPLEQNDWSLEPVFEGVPWTRARTFSRTDEGVAIWTSYDRNKGSGPLRYFSREMAIWVNVESDTTLQIAGIVPATTSIPLRAGWNLVGYPAVSPRSAADVLSGLPWNSAEASDPTPPYFLRRLDDDDMLEPGFGFWIEVVTDCTLTVTT